MKAVVVITLSSTLVAGGMAAGRLAAQTTSPSDFGVPPASTLQIPAAVPAPPTTPVVAQAPTSTPATPAVDASASVPVPTALGAVQNIVEITRLVPPGAAGVTAFTVPAGVVLIVTDVVVTNTGTAASCGAAVNRTGAATTTAATPPTTTTPATTSTTSGAASAVTTTVAGTVTQTDSTITGPLCVPAQTTTTLPLTTGIEFAPGQAVQLLNTTDAATAGGTGPGSLGFHLRGLLVTSA